MNLKQFLKITLLTAIATSFAIGGFLLSTINKIPSPAHDSPPKNTHFYPTQPVSTDTSSALTTGNESENKKNVSGSLSDINATSTEKNTVDKSSSASPADILNNVATTSAILNIPFTPQAPLGEWNDPRQQDGCEEASVLMAMRWVRGEKLSLDDARKEILAASDYQLEKYGEYRDTSAEDTAKRIVGEYYNHKNYRVRTNVTINDIIRELAAGHAVIAPMDGRTLNNPHFTPPGPIRHMLVIRGYDPDAKEFITNDPGTKRGEGYRYAQDILFGAIRDYPSGYHAPIKGVKKTVVVVGR